MAIEHKTESRPRDGQGRSYRNRMALALLVSLAAHAAIMTPDWFRTGPKELGTADQKPIVLNLQPQPKPKPKPVKRLVDSAVASNTPAKPTDLISDKESKASDLTDADSNVAVPAMPKKGDFDQLGRTKTAAPPRPKPAAKPEKETTPAKPKTKQKKSDKGKGGVQMAALIPEKLVPKMAAPPVPAPPPSPPAASSQHVPPQPPTSVKREAQSQSRVEGEAQNQGFLGFEAMRSQLAPYLQKIRDAVEKRWKIAMQLQYTGTDPTKAVIECSIRPDGHLAKVVIVDGGDSIGYGALCKQAIEKAGPFPPFPFKVPDMYRNENLRIRWTFSFL